MMSFRAAHDYTYVAQLLGRMIRTPLARRIKRKAELNNVSLFLPYFDETTVQDVVKALRENDAAAPADVGTARESVILKQNAAYLDVFSAMKELVTYRIDSVKKQPPIKLAMQLSRALTMDGVDLQALDYTQKTLVAQMNAEVEMMKDNGIFADKAKKITGFELGTFTFDYADNDYTFDDTTEQVSVADFDIQRHFEQAGKSIGEGLHTVYWIKNANREKSDVQVEMIVLEQSADSMERICSYAKHIFSDLYENNKRAIAGLPDNRKQVYARLTSSSAEPVAVPWQLPETIDFTKVSNSKRYDRHMYVSDEGIFEENFNSWEDGVICEEIENGAVCWLRNTERKGWALQIPYRKNGVYKPMYPDFVIVRACSGGYVFDILEPHDPGRDDNWEKSVGLAEFAEKHWDKFGRIQLIRKWRGVDGREHFYRLDVSKLDIRNRVKGITGNGELDRLFEDFAERED
jgi:type III restriction enzyme